MRRIRVAGLTIAAVAVVAAAVLFVTGFFSGGGLFGTAGPATGSAGSRLYATSAGVVWSFTPGRLGQVARSTNGGRTWKVMLPGPGPHTALSLTGSYFIGPDLGWTVHQYARSNGSGGSRIVTTVLGTTDGGRHWWHSAHLPQAANTGGCCSAPDYQLDFTDARHGWLYTMQWEVDDSSVWHVAEGLWRTSDGGHTWTAVRGHLPLRGVTDNADETCANEPPFTISFASRQDGWLTASSCSTIGSRPRIWRTTNGGAAWTPTALPAPGSGWPTANSIRTGVVVGRPWIIGSHLLAAVAGPAGLIIETSDNGGRTWHVAGPAIPGTSQSSSPASFQPVSASNWVVGTPGAMVRTADAGRRWRVIGTTTALPGGPLWFTGPSQGYARLRTGAIATTGDGGRTWHDGAAPPPEHPAPGLTVTGIQQISPAVAIATGPGQLRITRDGGRTWTPLATVPGRHPLGPAQFPAAATGFVTDQAGKKLWGTTDGGASWTALSPPPGEQPNKVQFWTSQIGTAVAITNNDLYLTTTGGNSWLRLAVPPGYHVNTFTQFSAPRYRKRPAYPGYACFSGTTGWLVAYPPQNVADQAVLASTDGGAHWRPVLPWTVLRTHGGASLSAWLAGCHGSQAWVEVREGAYRPGGGISYDLLHTADSGQTWQDVLHLGYGPAMARLAVPRTADALATTPLPSGLVLIPEQVETPSASVAWLTLLSANGGIAFAVTSDGGQHWQIHWFPAPRHNLRAAPASPSGLPWLATTATDAQHAWALLASTNGSGDSYLYATSDGGATWHRVTTFS